MFKLFTLTAGWLVGSAGGAVVTFLIAFTGWKDPNRAPVLDVLTKGMALLSLAFFVLAPLGIAAVARDQGMRRTAVGYMVLSAVVALGLLIQFTLSPL